jgi:hypothetical protein
MGLSNRATTAGHFGLELSGNFAGWVSSADGGMGAAEVISEKLGSDHFVRKHISGVKYDDITLVCGTGMSEQFYKWIKKSFELDSQRVSGAIIGANFDMKEVSRLSFMDALVAEYSLPALDASAKDPARMTVKIHPEHTRTQWPTGKDTVASTIDARKQKQWLASNFRLSIDGLEDACRVVSKVEPLSVRQKNVDHAIGDLRDYQQEPATLEFSNLVISLAESASRPFFDWHKEFVLDGNCGEAQERTATLEMLASDRTTVLFKVDLAGLGIFKLTPDKLDAGGEQIRRVKVEMYCESMTFNYKDSTWA